MKFSEAYERMKEGHHITLPEWGGYWAWEHETIMIHTRDGEVLGIRETPDTDYTFSFICRDDWMTMEEKSSHKTSSDKSTTAHVLHKGINTIRFFSFAEAMERLLRGERVCNIDWNRGDFVYLVRGSKVKAASLRNEADFHIRSLKRDTDDVLIKDHIDKFIFSNSSIQCGYTFTQEDITSTNWVTFGDMKSFFSED